MKKIFVVAISIAMLLISIHVSAVDNVTIPLLENFVYCTGDYDATYTDVTCQVYIQSVDNNAPVYIFFVGNIPYLVTTNEAVYGNAGVTGSQLMWNSQYSNISASNINAGWQYDSSRSLSYRAIQYPPSSITNKYAPTFETLQDGLDNIVNPPSQESRTMTLNLPAGNVAYIELDNTYDKATFAVTMPTASYAIGSSPWPESNQQYFFTSTLPSVGNFDPQGTKINWLRNGKTTLAGITTQASSSISGSASGTYLCVVNPAYYGGTANGPYEFLMNSTVSITVNGFVRVKIFQLESTLGLPADPTDHSQLIVNTAVNGTDYEGEVDEDTGNIIWTDNEEPVVGGGNLVTPSVSGFQSWLQGVLDSIVNIFEPAHNAIQTLASAVSNFAGWLYALYIWLPSPVLSVLTSAITLAIIIGVVKVFI